MKKFSLYFWVITVIFFGLVTILDFETSKESVLRGMIICSRVIIPSLFPFTVCLIFIINSNTITNTKFVELLGRPFRLSGEEMSVFIFSLIGGYPTGANLLKELHNGGCTSKNKAKLLINCCINAGPSFIISAIGYGIFHSKRIGVVLFFSHIFSSFILLALLRNKFEFETKANRSKFKHTSITENFVNSTACAASAVMNICFYVILFSTITAYFSHFCSNIKFSKYIIGLLEVTVGASNSNNIYFISFLLGFSGISIWMQIFSISSIIKPDTFLFAIYRILHGSLSVIFTYIIIKLFKIKIPVYSTATKIIPNTSHSGIGIGLSIVVLSVFLIFCVENKKRSGNFVEDLL